MPQIRSLEHAEDVRLAAQIYVRSWQHSYRGVLPRLFLDKLTHERFAAAIGAELERTLLLFDGNDAVGACTYGFSREAGREGFGEIASLYLLPESKGFGFGRALLEAALDRLRLEGCEQVCLWVFAENACAIGFYEHMGFVLSGERQQERFAGEEAVLLEMIRSL